MVFAVADAGHAKNGTGFGRHVLPRYQSRGTLRRRGIMTNGSDAVRQHYAMSGILDRVTAFLLERGIDPERPTYQDFFPFDQLHGRGVEATREHIKRAGINSSMLVMDLGCGVGGCSRVIA